MNNSRLLAYQVLLSIERNISFPDRLIRSTLERHADMRSEDRGLLTELVYGVLRWQAFLDWHIDLLSRIKPDKIHSEVRILLRLALYQLLFLDRIPDHAAVNETINLAKLTQPRHVTGFVNAILREAVRRKPKFSYPPPDDNPAVHLAVTTSHPLWLVERFLDRLGFEESREALAANNVPAPMVFRTNSLKTKPDELLGALLREGVDAVPSPYLPTAIRVASIRRDITKLQIYSSGWIQVQDEASQLIAHIVDPKPGERILDACAGFGGKSTHLAILMGNMGEIIALDQSSWKLQELQINALRQGIGIIRTTEADLLEWDGVQTEKFDRVLVDAPCTGLGTIRRNPDIKWRCKPKDPYRSSLVQSELLKKASRMVRPGGVLVYATCTVTHEENELVAAGFKPPEGNWQIDPVAQFLPAACQDMVVGNHLQTWPHRHGMDRFFAARWRRIS